MTRLLNIRLVAFIGIGLVLALALWLRWQFLSTVYPYPDEFVTLLAVQQILETGLPLLPSGLFYEHGLLFSYLGASFSQLFGFSREVVRWASLLCGLLTIWLTWFMGRRWFSQSTGLMAAFILALAPTAILWSGRARMYALLQFLVLVSLYLAFMGIINKRAKLRWFALLTFLGASLTHFLAVILVPPVLVALLAVAWTQTKFAPGSAIPPKKKMERNGAKTQREKTEKSLRLRAIALKNWRAYLSEGLALGGIVALAFVVKRLGQPKGIAQLKTTGSDVVGGIAQVWAIYSDFSLDLAGNWQTLAPFFTAPGMGLVSVLAGVGVALAIAKIKQEQISTPSHPSPFKGEGLGVRVRVSNPNPPSLINSNLLPQKNRRNCHSLSFPHPHSYHTGDAPPRFRR